LTFTKIYHSNVDIFSNIHKNHNQKQFNGILLSYQIMSMKVF